MLWEIRKDFLHQGVYELYDENKICNLQLQSQKQFSGTALSQTLCFSQFVNSASGAKSYVRRKQQKPHLTICDTFLPALWFNNQGQHVPILVWGRTGLCRRPGVLRCTFPAVKKCLWFRVLCFGLFYFKPCTQFPRCPHTSLEVPPALFGFSQEPRGAWWNSGI